MSSYITQDTMESDPNAPLYQKAQNTGIDWDSFALDDYFRKKNEEERPFREALQEDLEEKKDYTVNTKDFIGMRDTYDIAEKTGTLSTSLPSSYSHETRYNKINDWIHATSWEISMEGSARGLKRALANYIAEEPETLNPEQAHLFARELGIEKKFDKNITKGRVRYEVDRELLKQARENELQKYLSYGDYSSFENLMFGVAAMTGAIPATDIGVMIGSSALLGAGVEASLANLAKAAKATRDLSEVAKLVQTGNKVANITNKITKYENVANDIALSLESRGKAVEIAKAMMSAEKVKDAAQIAELTQQVSKLSYADKLAYDAYRMTKVAQGTHGSAASVGTLFAADAVISDIPRVAMKLANSAMAEDDSYTLKDATAEELLNAAGAFALPLGWTGGKKLFSVLGELQKEVGESITTKASSSAVEATLKGHTKEAKEAIKTGEETKKAIDDVINKREVSPAAQEIIASADYIGNCNMSESGVTALTGLLQKVLAGELSLNRVLDNFVERNVFLSTVQGLSNTVKESIANKINALDFFEIMTRTGVKIEAQNLHHLDHLSAVKNFLTTAKGSSIKVLGNGALEQKAFMGINPNASKVFMHEVYKYLFGEGDASIEAGIKATQMLDNLKEMHRIVREIRMDNDEIMTANKAAMDAGGVPAFTYKEQMTMYNLGNGQYGGLRQALENLADRFLSSTDKSILSSGEGARAILEGRKPNNQFIEAEVRRKEFRKWFWEQFGEYKGSGKLRYENLKAHAIEGTNEAERTGPFHEIEKALEQMIEHNEQLLNSGELFQYNYGNNLQGLMDRMLAEDVPELSMSGAQTSRTRAQITSIVNNNTKLKEQVDVTSAAYDVLKTTMVDFNGARGKVAVNIHDFVSKLASNITSAIGMGSASKNTANMFGHNEMLLTKLDNFFKSDLLSATDSFIAKIQEHSLFKNMLKASPESMANMLRAGRQQFKEALSETILAPIKEGVGDVPRKLDEALDEAYNNFVEHIRSMKEDETGDVLNLFQKQEVQMKEDMKQVDFEAQYLAVRNQRKAFQNILAPFIDKVVTDVAHLQVETQQNQIKIINAISPMLQRPGRMGEMGLGIFTFTSTNAKGIGLSVEALSNPKAHIENLWKRISESGGEELKTYAKDTNNLKQIVTDAMTIMRKEKGLLSKEEELAFEPGSQSARIAQALIDESTVISEMIQQEGGNFIDFVHPLSRVAVRGENFLLKIGKKTFDGAGEQGINNNNIVLQGALDALRYESNADKKRLFLYAFEDFDLDKYLNSNGFSKVSYNELRDTILSGDVRKLTTRFTEDEIRKAAKNIERGIVGGVDDQGRYIQGIIPRMIEDSSGIPSEYRVQKSRFLEDAKPPIYFKNAQAEREALDWYGPESFEQWSESILGNAKRTHGIIAKLGTEPYEMADSIKAISYNMAHGSALKELKDEAGNALFNEKEISFIQKKYDDEMEQKYDYMKEVMLGGFSTPATGYRRWVPLLINLMGTPMIAASPIKGLTDFSNILQHMVSLGISTGGDWKLRSELLGHMFATLPGLGSAKSNNMIKDLFMVEGINQGMLFDLMSSGGEANLRGAEGREALEVLRKLQNGEISPDAPLVMKYENNIKALTNGLNKILRITSAAEKNRSYAGFHIMRGIAENSHLKYEALADAMKQSLDNYGIGSHEWEFLRGRATVKVDDMVNKWHNTTGSHYGDDYKIFCPDAIIDIPKEEIISFMKGYKDKKGNAVYKVINDTSIQSVRDKLYNQASAMINSGADEAMNIPNARVQAMLRGYRAPGSKAAIAWKVATQFQSFGLMTAFSLFARRFHSFIKADDPLLVNWALASSGIGRFGRMAGVASLGGLIAETAVYNGILYEALALANGKSQSIFGSDGEVQPKVVGDKFMKYLTDSVGLYGVALDTISGSSRRGAGGGLAVPIAPVASSVIGDVSKIATTASKKENEGRRLQAASAQAALGVTTYFSKPPFMQAVFNTAINNKLREASMGPRSYAQLQNQRYKEGYQESWSDVLADKLFTNN